MKFALLAIAIAFTVLLTGCHKDAEVQTFITTLDSTTAEIVKHLESNPTAAGVDEAQKALDAKKADLKAKLDIIRGLEASQVSDDMETKLTNSIASSQKAMMDVSISAGPKLGTDPAAAAKFKKLTDDYTSAVMK
jgi:hypothetical protein